MLEGVVDPIVAAGRRAMLDELAARGDLLAMVLEARDEWSEALGDDDIRKEVSTMVLAPTKRARVRSPGLGTCSLATPELVDPRPLDVNGQGLLRPERPVRMRVIERERVTH